MAMVKCPKCGFANIAERTTCKQCSSPLGEARFGATQSIGSIDATMITSALSLPGYQITRSHGVVRGLIVRSPGFGGSVVASFQALTAGNIQALTDACERARVEAFRIMVQHAADLGANAVVGFAYDTTEIANGITEVLAYGTAVWVDPSS